MHMVEKLFVLVLVAIVAVLTLGIVIGYCIFGA
jgi:hypothetical protein